MTTLTTLSKQLTTVFNMHDIPVFKTSNEFSMHIEKLAIENKITHMEAVLKFCESHMLEPDEISSKINKSLKEKIENDFRTLNYLPKQAQLDM
jgi:cell division ATPase FtsA